MSEMIERVAKAIGDRSTTAGNPPGSHMRVARLPDGVCADLARAAIEAITAGAFAEYRILSADGELWAETNGTPSVALNEARHYAAQEHGAVIEQVVCIPLSPSLKEQEEGN